MDFDTIRPIVSGLIGAAIAGWLAIKLVGRLPYAENATKQRALIEEERLTIRYANIGAGIGLGIGLMFYFGGFVDRNDWRGIGIGGGLMGLLPLLIIVGRNLHGGMQTIKNGFIAFAIAQKTPVLLLLLFIGLMITFGVLAVIAFIPKKTDAEQVASCNPLPAAVLAASPVI